ncbi:MAG: GNAT family N-acetyltransferase [Pseudonocardiaceae bacterium]
MSDRLTVRPARPDELDQVGRLTFEVYVADGHANPEGSYAAALADAPRRARDAELLVAVDAAGMLLGTITVCLPGSPLRNVSRTGELELRMLAVDLGARRRGVGQALVTAVLKRATEIGAHRVVLSSAEDMYAAHRLYARLGFSRMPERDWQPAPGATLLVFGATVTC